MVYILLWRTWNCSYTLETENSRTIQDYSAGNKQSMSGLRMMLQTTNSEQTAVCFILMSSWSFTSRVFNFLTMSFNVSCLSTLSLFCLFNNSLFLVLFLFLFLSSLCRPQRAQLSSNQDNWVTLQLEWTLGLSCLWKMSILLPLIFCNLLAGLGGCDIPFVSGSLRGLEWQNLISCRIKQYAFNLGVKG